MSAAEPRPAEMCTAFDVIQLAVDSGFQAMSLALSFAVWKATRPRQPQVAIERNGTTVTLDGPERDTTKVIVEIFEQETEQ